MFLRPHRLGGKTTLDYASRAVRCRLGQRATYCAQSGPASTSVPRSLLRLMPLGGSVTHGVGSSDQNGYRKTLFELLHARGFNVRMVGSRKAGSLFNSEHEGWRGFRIDQIESRARPSAAKLSPHVFTVNAGSNDCLQGYKLSGASKRLGNLVETLWLASPGSTVVLSSLIVNRDEAVDRRVGAFNEQVEALAQTKVSEGKRIVFVDMHGGNGPAVGDLIGDGTHPNDAGYVKMAEIWAQGVQVASDRGFLSDLESYRNDDDCGFFP